MLQAHDLVVELLQGAGVTQLQSLALPGTAPVIVGEIPAPEGAPTVLLYSHYDVVPAGDESLWSSPPFEPTERDGALFGRGASDSKANVIAHVGALRAWDGRPPVGIKLVIEGQEEVGGGDLMNYARSNPAAFASDAMIIADAGSVRPGVPTLTIGLRGMAQLEIEVNTLCGAKHSGQYGGAAPDALVVLIQALAALHDENGDVAVPGCGARSGRARITATRSSAPSPRSTRACRSREQAASAHGSGPARRSPSPGSTRPRSRTP